MTEPALILASGARAVTSPWHPVSSGSGRDLCIHYRAGKIAYWSPASRLPSASCRGNRRQGGGR
jgi:hypothetical protein